MILYKLYIDIMYCIMFQSLKHKYLFVSVRFIYHVLIIYLWRAYFLDLNKIKLGIKITFTQIFTYNKKTYMNYISGWNDVCLLKRCLLEVILEQCFGSNICIFSNFSFSKHFIYNSCKKKHINHTY